VFGVPWTLDELEKGCRTKRPFYTELEALERIKWKWEQHEVRLTFYRCRFCDWLHLTKKGVEQPRRPRA
jgi:hypothetical protein